MNTAKDLIARYEQGIRTVEEAVKATAPEVADQAPAPGKWTVRQIIAHIADADMVAAMRFRLIAAQPGSRLTPFDQDSWAKQLNYQQQSIESSLAAFEATRRFTAEMLRHLPDAAWKNTAIHEERGEVGLLAYVEHMCVHAENHAQQIRNIHEKFKPAAKA